MPHENRHTDNLKGFVYFIVIESEDVEYLKIGFSTNPRMRRHTLQTSLPFDIELEAVFRGTKEDERELHRRFAKYRARREWFTLTPDAQDLLDDLFDAQTLLTVMGGADYSPSMRQCLEHADETAAAKHPAPVDSVDHLRQAAAALEF